MFTLESRPLRSLASALAPALLLLALLPGCKAKDYARAPGASSASYGAEGDGYADEMAMEEAEGVSVYDFEDDDVDGDILMPEGANISSRARSRSASMGSFKKERSVDAPPSPAPQKAKPVAKADARSETRSEPGAKPAEAKPADKPEPDKHARQVIYTADMTIGVFDVEEAMEAAERTLNAVGGYVQSMSRGVLVMRVPAGSLRELMDAYAEFGVVEARTLQARDVTDEYVDLKSRIRVLRETRDQLAALLRKAHNVEQALAIRAELDRVNMELERAEARLRVLRSLIAYSTLTLNLIERGPHVDTPSGNDPFPWVDDLGVEATEWR